MSSIEWTQRTWNPIRGCSRVSPGCDHCYAIGQAHRFNAPPVQDPSGDRGLDKPAGPYHGLTIIRRGKVDWTGRAVFVPGQLEVPLKRRKPTTWFVNSMSDLFHESLSNEEIAAVFGVMAACPQHTFQVLTKRPRRAREWFEWIAASPVSQGGPTVNAERGVRWHAWQYLGDLKVYDPARPWVWPLPNVWLGVSAEDQQRADERIPLLLDTPAAVRFVSAEPLLGPIDFTRIDFPGLNLPPTFRFDALAGGGNETSTPWKIDWIVAGGESGPGARPCAIEWIESIVRQCRWAGTACFVKQLGGHVLAPWKLEWSERMDGSFDLFSTDRVGVKGTNLATVYPNCHWHTWDANGTGGENDTAPDIETAKAQAIKALARQHVHPLKGWARHRHMLVDRKGADPEEWPEDLRVREMPEVRS